MPQCTHSEKSFFVYYILSIGVMQYQYLSVTKCVLAYFEHTRNKNVGLWHQIAVKPFQHSVASCSYGGNLESKFCCVFLWIERQWQNKCLHGEVVWAYRFHIILYLYLACFGYYICGLHSCAFIWRLCTGLQISWKFDFENTRKKGNGAAMLALAFNRWQLAGQTRLCAGLGSPLVFHLSINHS